MEIHFTTIVNVTFAIAVPVYRLLLTNLADPCSGLLPASCYCSSICISLYAFMLNAGWCLLTAIASCYLLTTADRLKPSHICCLLHTAALSWVTWCWMLANTCQLTDWCLLSCLLPDPNCCPLSVTFPALLLPTDCCWQTYILSN